MRFLCVAGLGVLAACASSGQKVYVAPSNDTVTSTTEQGAGSTPSHSIYVVNESTEPIVVFGVALRDCENVREECESRPVNIRIAGGQRHVVLRVDPRDPRARFSYRFNYSWRPEKTPAPPLASPTRQ